MLVARDERDNSMKEKETDSERYIRVGTTLYKIVRKPLLSGDFMDVRVPWNYETLRQDHSKDYISQIEKSLHIYIIDANKVSKIAEISMVSAYKLIEELEKLNILAETTGGKRGRIYTMKEYIQIFTK